MLINLPDPLNFLVRSLTHEFMCKIEVGPKREECKKGGWCTGCQKFFEVGPRREKCEKGGGCEKGGCETVLHLGAKKMFEVGPKGGLVRRSFALDAKKNYERSAPAPTFEKF